MSDQRRHTLTELISFMFFIVVIGFVVGFMSIGIHFAVKLWL